MAKDKTARQTLRHDWSKTAGMFQALIRRIDELQKDHPDRVAHGCTVESLRRAYESFTMWEGHPDR